MDWINCEINSFVWFVVIGYKYGSYLKFFFWKKFILFLYSFVKLDINLCLSLWFWILLMNLEINLFIVVFWFLLFGYSRWYRLELRLFMMLWLMLVWIRDFLVFMKERKFIFIFNSVFDLFVKIININVNINFKCIKNYVVYNIYILIFFLFYIVMILWLFFVLYYLMKWCWSFWI